MYKYALTNNGIEPDNMPDQAEKIRRQKLILAILEAQPIISQEELADELATHDISVTQPTLSRDLRELRVTRAPTPEGYRYVSPRNAANRSGGLAAPEQFKQLAALEVTAVDANGSVVAIRTIPGRAQGLAAYLDSLAIPELMATIAGDDTVIAHPRRTRQTLRLRRRIGDLLGVV